MATKLYLNPHGVLLTRRNPRPLEGVREFLEFVIQHFDCYWLCDDCKGDAEPLLQFLEEYFSSSEMSLFTHFKPSCFESLKSEAINVSEPFIWVDSMVFAAEQSVLRLNRKLHCLILFDSTLDTLVDLKERLQQVDVNAIAETVGGAKTTIITNGASDRKSESVTPKVNTITQAQQDTPIRQPQMPVVEEREIVKETPSKPNKAVKTKSDEPKKKKGCVKTITGCIGGVFNVIFLLVVVGGLVWGGYVWLSNREHGTDSEGNTVFRNDPNNYRSIFNDLQDTQIVAAVELGIEPAKDRAEADERFPKMARKKQLVKLKNNKYYEIEKLTHSVPYVVPQVEDFLVELGRRFKAKSKDKHAKYYISSVTRTEEDVEKLTSVKIDATKNSCHLYGTTIDIRFSDGKFIKGKKNKYKDPEMRNCLFSCIREMREEGWCYVKYENRQGCLHITVRK